MDDFSSKYDPKGIEQQWYEFWLREKLFTPDLTSKKEPYTITIPPPNITGRLTIGHVLNNTVQDIIIRYKKLAGFEALWIPGMDHAGIATQVVVEERLMEQNIKREDLGREKFIAEVWKWKEEYAQAIRTQLKTMGCALDWTRECFTLSDGYSKKVIKIFVDLYNKGFIYRGEKIINWCPRCLTVISNEQVETEEKMDRLYFVRYPIKGTDDYITVATTRPETMLGDTAVCVNPEDSRYKQLVGKTAVLPIMNREILIIADSYVEPEFGTGALKVTPAHDQFDFDLARKHNLDFINIMNPDATLNENAGEFKGVERFEARKKIVAKLKEMNLLEKTENYKVPLATCERCHTIIEPKLSKQWFVKMKPLAEPALQAVRDGTVKIYPKRWVNLYYRWLENVIDWPISRQLWWGHRIPIYYCTVCYDAKTAEIAGKGIIVSETRPMRCPFCGSTQIEQDEDVLDTWFSSWLWPFATLGWPEDTADFRRFYPTQTLATGWDIIYLWVARMIMAGLEFTKQKPFNDVVFHTMIRDGKGRKMSKSLGNSPEPIDLIAKYGADALRLGLLLITPREQDVLFSEKSIDVGRRFCNKLWNASRLVMHGAQNAPMAIPEKASVFDLWIGNEFNQLLNDIEKHYKTYELNAIAKKLYDFIWHVFCDWYLEIIKLPPFNTENISQYLLKQILIVMHPFIPFITEEIYHRQKDIKKSIMLENWPRPIPLPIPQADIKGLINLIEEIRNIRGMFKINPKENLDIHIDTDDNNKTFIGNCTRVLQKLAGIDKVIFNGIPDIPAATIVLPKLQCYVLLKGIDVTKEKQRLQEEIDFLVVRIDEIKYRLGNPQHTHKLSEEFKLLEQKRLDIFLKKKTGIKNAIERL